VKVKANDDFGYWRLMTLHGLTVEEFRSLQQGKTVDLTKEVYTKNKHVLEVITPPKKEDKDGD